MVYGRVLLALEFSRSVYLQGRVIKLQFDGNRYQTRTERMFGAATAYGRTSGRLYASLYELVRPFMTPDKGNICSTQLSRVPLLANENLS